MNDLEQIEAVIAKNLTITDQRLMDGVIGAVMDAVNAEREACARLWQKDAYRYRFLRDRAWPFEFKGHSAEDADVAIDAAIDLAGGER